MHNGGSLFLGPVIILLIVIILIASRFILYFILQALRDRTQIRNILNYATGGTIFLYCIFKVISIPFLSYLDSVRYDWQNYSSTTEWQREYSLAISEGRPYIMNHPTNEDLIFIQEYKKPSDDIIELAYSFDSFDDLVFFNIYIVLTASLVASIISIIYYLKYGINGGIQNLKE